MYPVLSIDNTRIFTYIEKEISNISRFFASLCEYDYSTLMWVDPGSKAARPIVESVIKIASLIQGGSVAYSNRQSYLELLIFN